MKYEDVPVEERDRAEEMAEAVMQSLLPRSKATNAYELCEEVCQAITEEPRRYNQRDWLMNGVYFIEKIYRRRKRDAPDCGTVGCYAGWMVTLRGKRDLDMHSVANQAADLLGFSNYHSHQQGESDEEFTAFWTENVTPIRKLFDDDLHRYVDDLQYDESSAPVMPEKGTPEYAALGVKKLRAFMAKHEERLKAKAV